MPIYEFRCGSCSYEFELRRGFGEDSTAPCPQCQGDGRRLFSPVPIIFKGSGFYVTDNRARNSAVEGNSGSKADSAEDGSSKSKADNAEDGASKSKADSAEDGNSSEKK